MGGQTCFMLTVKNPFKYHGIILYAPAIKDNEFNAAGGKFFAKIIGSLHPTMEVTVEKKRSANKNPAVRNY